MFRVFTLKLIAILLLSLTLAACDSVEDRIAKHYERGQELVAAGEPEKAALEFQNVLKLNGDHVGATFALGLIYEEKRELDQAFARFLRTAELDPSHVEARAKTAKFYLIAGRTEEARRHLTAARETDPTNIEVLVMTAALANLDRDFDAAREALDAALAVDPDHLGAAVVEAEYLRDTVGPEMGLARVEEGLKIDAENVPLQIAKLQMLSAIGDKLALGAQLQTLIDLDIDEFRFRDLLYRWAMENDRPDVAEEQLRLLAEEFVDDRESVFRYIRFLNDNKDTETARAELLRLKDLAEDDTRLELMAARLDYDTDAKDRAVALLQEMIAREDHGSNRARMAYANILLDDGDLEPALELTKYVLDHDPTNVEALVIWGAHLVEENRLDEAVQVVRTGLNEEPTDVRLLTLAGRTQERLGNIDLANDRYARAARESRFATVNTLNYVDFLYRLERLGAAETVLSEATRRRPRNAEIAERLGFTRARLEDWNGARQVARHLETLSPESARRVNAAILVGQERFDEGASLLRNLSGEEIDAAMATSAILQTYIAKRDFNGAVVYLDGLLEENPENVQALGLRGNLHVAVQEFDEAEALYRKVLEIDPANEGAFSALARLRLRQGDEQAADTTLSDGLAADPDSLFLMTRMAQLRERQGRIDEAIELYGRVYDKAPNALLVANNMASLIADYRSDDARLMEKAYQMAGRLRMSSYAQYRDTYAWTRYMKGEYKEALASMEEVVLALPDNPWVRYHIGMIYSKLGEVEKARENLELALKLAGDGDFPPRGVVDLELKAINEG